VITHTGDERQVGMSTFTNFFPKTTEIISTVLKMPAVNFFLGFEDERIQAVSRYPERLTVDHFPLRRHYGRTDRPFAFVDSHMVSTFIDPLFNQR